MLAGAVLASTSTSVVATRPATLAPATYAPATYAPATYPATYAAETYATDTYAAETYPATYPSTYAAETYATETYAPTTYAPATYAPTTYAPETYAPTTYAPETYAPTTLAPATLAQRYTLGEKGQSCHETCGGACDDAVQGATTYGRDIVFGALSGSGHAQFDNPELNVDEWRDNLRVRDDYHYNGGEFRAVPGLWIRGANQAVPNWKNPQFTQMPSTCGARWGDMRRLCACTPP
jgi:hypothetical protein